MTKGQKATMAEIKRICPPTKSGGEYFYHYVIVKDQKETY